MTHSFPTCRASGLSTGSQRCHLGPAAFVVSPYASVLASLVEDELELGATVIDMGGGTTTIAVFYEHNVIFTDAIPVGGHHVTSDIARGLSTPLAHAERMRSEERRVGKECVSTCRSRWSPYP